VGAPSQFTLCYLRSFFWLPHPRLLNGLTVAPNRCEESLAHPYQDPRAKFLNSQAPPLRLFSPVFCDNSLKHHTSNLANYVRPTNTTPFSPLLRRRKPVRSLPSILHPIWPPTSYPPPIGSILFSSSRVGFSFLVFGSYFFLIFASDRFFLVCAVVRYGYGGELVYLVAWLLSFFLVAHTRSFFFPLALKWPRACKVLRWFFFAFFAVLAVLEVSEVTLSPLWFYWFSQTCSPRRPLPPYGLQTFGVDFAWMPTLPFFLGSLYQNPSHSNSNCSFFEALIFCQFCGFFFVSPCPSFHLYYTSVSFLLCLFFVVWMAFLRLHLPQLVYRRSSSQPSVLTLQLISWHWIPLFFAWIKVVL